MTDSVTLELCSLDFFDEATLMQQSGLISAVREHTYQPGEVIYHHGEQSEYVHIVRNGLVKLMSYLPSGRSRIVRLHKRSSIIGMESLMDDDHEHTAVAVDEVNIFQISHTELLKWKQDSPELYAQLLEKWYQYLNFADTWITDFSTGSVKGRVARLIRFLAHFDEDTGPQVTVLLTTEEMSEILAVTPESVSRVIAEFKREGIITPIENNSESLFTFERDMLDNIAHE